MPNTPNGAHEAPNAVPAPASPPYMLDLSERLFDQGWPIIPILPGAKSPGAFFQGEWRGYADWSKFCDRMPKTFEMQMWRRWPPCGIGIACGPSAGIIAFDIDVLDEEASFRIKREAFIQLGETPAVRVGKRPKTLLVYRTAPGVIFKPIKKHPLEFLAYGNQFVAYATHPDTGAPYQWVGGDDLTAIAPEDLPVIDRDQALKLMAIAEMMVPPSLRQTSLGPDRSNGNFIHVGAGAGGAGGAGREYLGYDEMRGTREAVADAMRFIPNDDLHYNDWVRIGYAIKGALGDDGFDIFAEWSARATKDVPSFTAKAWPTFGVQRSGAGTIYWFARQYGWEPDTSTILRASVAEAMAEVSIDFRAFVANSPRGRGLYNPLADREEAQSHTTAGNENGADPKISPAPSTQNHHTNDEGNNHTQENANLPGGDERNMAAPRIVVNPVPAYQPFYTDDGFDPIQEAGGRISMLVNWMVETAKSPQPELALGASLCTLGALMGHKYRLLDGPDTRTNLMALGLAGSSSGKDHARRCIMAALDAAGLRPYVYNEDVASAQGIYGMVGSFFAGVCLLDEAGHFFKLISGDKASTAQRAIVTVMTKLFTSSTALVSDGARAELRNANAIPFMIPAPCFNIFATTVPGPFWDAMESGNAIDGFLARWLIFEASENVPRPNLDAPQIAEMAAQVGRHLKPLIFGPGGDDAMLDNEQAIAAALGSMRPGYRANTRGQQIRHVEMPEVPIVPMTLKAQETNRAMAIREWEAKVALQADDGKVAIIGRLCELSRKLALIRAVSRNPTTPLVGHEDLEWAERVVTASQDRMMAGIRDHVADSPVEMMKKRILAVVRRGGENGIMRGELIRATQRLTKEERNGAIHDLVEGGELIVHELKSGATGGRPGVLYKVVDFG